MASKAWALTGNAQTNPATNALGTSDNEPLVIETNGTERVRVDTSGNVGIGTKAPQSALQIKSLTALSEGPTAAGAWANFGSNRYYDGSWKRIDPTKAGVNLHMNADDGAGQEFRFQRVEADGSNSRNIGAIGSKTSFIGEGNVGIGTTSPQKPLDVASSGGIRISQSARASDTNELYFADNGQIRSLDDNHRIIFNRATNDLELREYGTITLSPGATQGNRTAKVLIDPSNVGIGMDVGTAPTERLSVRGEEVTVHGFGAAIGLSNIAPGGRKWYFRAGANGTATPAGGLSVADDIAYRLVIDNSGKIGIGTNAPASSLHVAGDVTVTGDVLLTGADCAEEFDVAGPLPEAGTVVVIDDEGSLRQSREAYDKKVAGVVSGAGEYRHGLVLDKRSKEGRIPVALMGKAYCKVDARYSPVEVGDLLTTSQTPGHAMKVMDPTRAFGSVIGKALKSLEAGQGVIPILVALR